MKNEAAEWFSSLEPARQVEFLRALQRLGRERGPERAASHRRALGRRVHVLERALLGQSHGSIARLLQVTPERVKQIVHRGLLELRHPSHSWTRPWLPDEPSAPGEFPG